MSPSMRRCGEVAASFGGSGSVSRAGPEGKRDDDPRWQGAPGRSREVAPYPPRAAALDCHVPVSRRPAGPASRRRPWRRSVHWTLGSVRRRRRPSLTSPADAGVLGRKHIPSAYLRAAPWQRLALLQGLMDTDGSVSRDGRCEITLKDDQLAATWAISCQGWDSNGSASGGTWSEMAADLVLLTLPLYSVAEFPSSDWPGNVIAAPRPKKRGSAGHRQVVAIEPVASVPVRCIQVDSRRVCILRAANGADSQHDHL